MPPAGSTRPSEIDLPHHGVTPGALDWSVIGSVSIAVPNPTGLTCVGQYFRVPDWVGGNPSSIYTIDPATGLVVGSIPAPAQWPGGITYDGNYLWVTDYIQQMVICKIDPNNGHIINTYPIPYSYYWAGAAWDGQYVYFGVNTSPGAGQPDYIYKMDPNTGVILSSFAIPSTYISGLTYYDGHLWYSDSQEMTLYKITTNGVIVESSPAQGSYPSGMTFFNGYLYNVDNDLCLIYQYNITPPVMEVTLTPFNPPITIPANGGSFQFNIEVSNLGTSMANFDVWTMVTLPSGGSAGPLLLAQNLNFAPGASADRDRQQFVPAGAPSGIYSYNAFVGDYPNTVWTDDEFNFEKLTVDDGGICVPGWECWGEEFADKASGLTSNFPADCQLLSVYPNPFNPTTAVSFSLPYSGDVSLVVYDITGRQIASLVNSYLELGTHEFVWNASSQASGVFFVRLQAGRLIQTQKILLLK